MIFSRITVAVCVAAIVLAAPGSACAQDAPYSCRQLHDAYRQQVGIALSYAAARDGGNAAKAKALLASLLKAEDGMDSGRMPSENLDSGKMGCDEETVFFQDKTVLLEKMIDLRIGRQPRTRDSLELAYAVISNFVSDYRSDRAAGDYEMLLGFGRRVNAWCSQEHIVCDDSWAWSWLRAWPNAAPTDSSGVTMHASPMP